MRRFFQTEWHGIQFSKYFNLDSGNLPTSAFYNKFYKIFYEKYESYESLDSKWRKNKDGVVDWLESYISEGDSILSIGCGIGYIEYKLWERYNDKVHLHVQDYASDALCWLRQTIPTENIYDSKYDIEQNLHSQKFDLIYLVAVDYALSNIELITLLSKLKNNLNENGSIKIVSASYLDENIYLQLKNSMINYFKWFLDIVGLYNRGQFWGWLRTSSDYHYVLFKAGFSSITHDFINTENQRSYCINGNK